MNTITPNELNDRLQRGEKSCLLDVRTPAEYSEVHVPGTHLVPLDRIGAGALARKSGFLKDQPLYIFCHSGGRARQAAAKLEKDGYTQCQIVEGGTLAWTQAGLPVIRGAATVISLERQVRIVAGSIVLLGVLLAHFVNPAFLWLSGFIGAGLTFAGITGWCGMGMLIAKLPWNQRGGGSCKT